MLLPTVVFIYHLTENPKHQNEIRFITFLLPFDMLFTLSLTRPSPKLSSPVWPWPGEPSDLHWLGKSCIVGEISHLHLA